MVQPNYDYRAISDERRRAAGGRRGVREVGDLGLHGRGRDRRPRARRSRRLPHARRDEPRRAPAAGGVPLRSHAQRRLHAEHEGVSEEHRDRSHVDARDGRRPGAADQDPARSAGASATSCRRRGDDGAPASLVHRAAGRQLQAARVRSARRLLRRQLRGLLGAVRQRRAACAIISRHRLAEARSERGGERGGQADRLLRRSRRARADSVRAARGRVAGGTRRSKPPATATPSASS